MRSNPEEKCETITTSQWYMNKKACNGERYEPSRWEHVANILTHAVWVLPCFVQTWRLLERSTTSAHYYSGLVYGLSMSSMFLVSSIFHVISFWQSESGQSSKSHSTNLSSCHVLFHKCDRAIIYFFIAGSYTPWLMLKAMGFWGGQMRWIIWLMCILGITYQYIYHAKHQHLDIIFYILIGVTPSLFATLSFHEHGGVEDAAWAGAIYLVGVVFFKLDGVIPFAHAIWHVFVVLGSFWQYVIIAHHLFP